jgi:hypothetical protein
MVETLAARVVWLLLGAMELHSSPQKHQEQHLEARSHSPTLHSLLTHSQQNVHL